MIRNRASKCTCSSGDTTAGYHEFCQHTSSCPANIDSQGSHEAIDLLTHFEKPNGTQEPDEDIAGNFFLTGRCNGTFHFTLIDGKSSCGQSTGEQHEHKDCEYAFSFHVYLLIWTADWQGSCQPCL